MGTKCCSCETVKRQAEGWVRGTEVGRGQRKEDFWALLPTPTTQTSLMMPKQPPPTYGATLYVPLAAFGRIPQPLSQSPRETTCKLPLALSPPGCNPWAESTSHAPHPLPTSTNVK